jgi:hypothetical protein
MTMAACDRDHDLKKSQLSVEFKFVGHRELHFYVQNIHFVAEFAAAWSVLLGGGRTTPTTPLRVDLLISCKHGSNHIVIPKAQLVMRLQMSALLLFWKGVTKVTAYACGQ